LCESKLSTVYTKIAFFHKNPNVLLGAGRVNLFVSDDGQRIVSVVQNHKVNVWEQVGFSEEGEWTNVSIHTGVLTSLASKETSIDARFFSNQVRTYTYEFTIMALISYLVP